MSSRAVVLVEGRSDQIAVRTLAARRGRDLAAEGISVLAVGGAQAMGRYLSTYGPAGADATVAGL
ncbi:MAG TPA: TOPRIM nucleotidyl transferase/hydrolase domain-containing protein, partial [Gaiellales bacterium]|nr:TOPRIM nucleotidyl transferase/hydrolase domain-containing protein [Gaiellales bacterium]